MFNIKIRYFLDELHFKAVGMKLWKFFFKFNSVTAFPWEMFKDIDFMMFSLITKIILNMMNIFINYINSKIMDSCLCEMTSILFPF